MKKYNVTVNGTLYEVEVEEIGAADDRAPVSATPSSPAPKTPSVSNAPAGQTPVKAPMPGNILKVEVKEGDAVKKGALLCILEAMKMENEIFAPEDGKVAAVNVRPGASVQTGDIMFTLG